MPGWHQATKKLRENDDLIVLGVVQEQHAERARLYAQWKEFDWPIVQDQMNSIGIAIVPVAVLIDEFGVVQNAQPRPNQIQELVAENRKAPEIPAPKLTTQDASLRQSEKQNSVYDFLITGDEQLKTGKVNAGISSYNMALQLAQSSADESLQQLVPAINFRLGVAYRAKFDADADQDPPDFATAAKYWTMALNGNPNQYIWRRRIEQYGPRNIKPYPFYDWVDLAITEIKNRGEEPVNQKVELSGAEIAQPAKGSMSVNKDAENPDPESEITKFDSSQPRIGFSAIVVPSQIEAGKSVRVHLKFVIAKGTQWNNDSSPMQIWLNKSETGVLSQQLFEIANAPQPNSTETRSIEFEYQTNKGATDVELTGFVLVNVCTEDEGQCLFRRRDFTIKIPISK